MKKGNLKYCDVHCPYFEFDASEQYKESIKAEYGLSDYELVFLCCANCPVHCKNLCEYVRDNKICGTRMTYKELVINEL